jgi:hypothetical protein
LTAGEGLLLLDTDGVGDREGDGVRDDVGDAVIDGVTELEGELEVEIDGEGELEGVVDGEDELEGVADGEGELEVETDGEGELEGVAEGELVGVSSSVVLATPRLMVSKMISQANHIVVETLLLFSGTGQRKPSDHSQPKRVRISLSKPTNQ